MDDIFLFVEVMNFKKFKGRTDVEKPSWFRCSNEILEDDDFHDFTAPEMCAMIYIFSQSNKQTAAIARLNLEKIDGLNRKFNREDLRSAIAKAERREILKLHVTPPLRGRNVDVTSTYRIGEDRQTDTTDEEESVPPKEPQAPPASDLASPRERPSGNLQNLLAAIPEASKLALIESCKGYGGEDFMKSAAANAFAFHSSRPESAGWKISHWVSKISAAIDFAKKKAPVPFKATPTPVRPRAAPDPFIIKPVTAKEALSNASRSPIAGIVAKLSVARQMAGAG